MSDTVPVVVTISRQLGSGAAFVGRRLAARFGMAYLDRELLQRAAQELAVPEDELEGREETVTTFWQSFVATYACGCPEAIYVPPTYRPTDLELFAAVARIVRQVAHAESAVIVGRGGVHVLREHPRHVSVFLHAALAFRVQRVAEVYQVSPQEARAMVEACDKDRARYHRKVADSDWSDARQYSLCLDTGMLGVDATVEVIASYLGLRFGVSPTG
jgi:cytidylate kinase